MTPVTANNTQYNVLTWGKGVPLVLIHGFSGNAASWQGIAAILGAQYRVIAIDVIGHGESDKPTDVYKYQMQNVAHDLAMLMQPEERVHLLGYSMGGRLALYMACHYPQIIRSLILESASPGLKTEAERLERTHQDNTLADRIERDGIAAFVDAWEKVPLWATQHKLPADILQAQRQQRLNNDPVGLANNLRGMGTGVQPSLWGCLPRLSIPVQLITGGSDAKFTVINQEMAGLLPNAHLNIIPDAGHNTHLEQEERFLQVIHHFLKPL